MTEQRKFALLLVLIPLLMSLSCQIPSASTSLQGTPIPLRVLADSHIAINGNADLNATASEGNGTLVNPYRIAYKLINASESGTHGIAIRNTDAYFLLHNCTITNAKSSYAGIYLENVTNARIENNTIDKNWHGIYLSSNAKNNWLTSNTVTLNNGNGIYLILDSNNNTLIDNTVRRNSFHGIYIYNSSFNTLTDNSIILNTVHGIFIESSHNTTLIENTVSGNHNGIQIYLSHNTTLSSNIANGNVIGLTLRNSSESQLDGNTANENAYGIYLQNSPSNRLSDNTANQNTASGIHLLNSSSNRLSGNTAHQNTYGIRLVNSNYNTIIGNDLRWNEVYYDDTNGLDNQFQDNRYADSEIAGFTWAAVLLGLMGLYLAALAFRRRDGS